LNASKCYQQSIIDNGAQSPKFAPLVAFGVGLAITIQIQQRPENRRFTAIFQGDVTLTLERCVQIAVECKAKVTPM